MRKIHIVLVLTAIFSVQPLFAYPTQDAATDESKPCAEIAKACLDAGYNRDENATKKFWFDCMKPVVLGKTVEGVTIDAATAKECRVNKIDELKKELKEFQKR